MVSLPKCAAALAAGVFVLSARVSKADEKPAPMTLDDAVRRAVEKNVEVELAVAAIEEANSELRAARVFLPANPEIEVSRARRTDGAGGESADFSAALSQEVEIAFQRGSRVNSARARLAQAEALLVDRRRRVASDVRGAFLLALAGREKVRFAEQVEGLGKSLSDAAKQREEAGSGTALETNLAKIEWGDAKRFRITAQRELAERIADLGRLLSMRPSEMGEITGELLPPPRRALDLDALRSRARERSASLRAGARATEAARAGLTLARRETVSNLTVRGGWESEADGAEEIAGVGISLPIPLFRRNQAGIGSAKAEMRRADAHRLFTEASVEQEIEVAWLRLEAAREELDVFDADILAQVEENLKLLQASLAAGKSNLLEVLVVQRRLVDTRREYLDALAAAGSADAEIARLLGAEEGVQR